MAANPNILADISNGNNISYMGPARHRYPSLRDLASKSLDDYCPNWNDYLDPRSYLVPPVFTFKNPEVSDAIVEELRQFHHDGYKPIKDRKSEEAEYLVFVALQRIIDDGLFAPFLAFRGVDLKLYKSTNGGRLKGDLVDLFRAFNWSEYQKSVKMYSREGKVRSGSGEYDFILIGPKFGIIYIEVKSQEFHTMDKFREDYLYGVKQLAAAEVFFRQFLFDVTKIGFYTPFTKVLFCPNFKREQYDSYVRQLSEEESELIERHTDYRFFEDDGENRIDEADMPAYFSAISHLLDEITTRRPTVNSTLGDWYPAYGRIISIISSIVVLKKRRRIVENREAASANHFSEAAAISNESDRIRRQCPLGNETVEHSPDSPLFKASNITDMAARASFQRLDVVYLSPDQRAVMDGYNRQFIVGPAGTGKTILLQAKALEMIRKGGRVWIFASKNMHENWKSILDEEHWPNVTDLQAFLEGAKAAGFTDFSDFWKMYGVVNGDAGTHITRNFRQLFSYLGFDTDTPRHIFIDDALFLEDLNSFYVVLVGLFLMTIASIASPNNVVLIAFDPNQVGSKTIALESNYHPEERRIKELLNKALMSDLCTQSVLHQIMRCSSSVFDTAYPGMESPRGNFTLFNLTNYRAILAHKIIGGRTTTIKEKCVTYNRGLAIMIKHVVKCIERHTIIGKIDLSHVGVVLSGAFFTEASNHTQAVMEHLRDALPNYDVTPWSERGVAKPTVTVGRWSDVSSSERPLVIHVAFLMKKNDRKPYEGRSHETYVARTRAIAALVEIEIMLVDNKD